MTFAVAILMKDPAEAKTRLRPVLDNDAREKLALLMFENTLAHFLRAEAADPDRRCLVGVVTPSPRIADFARLRGTEVINQEAGSGINDAAAKAAVWAQDRGSSSLLIVHADIPTLADEEIKALVVAGRTHAVVIAASVDNGTNALLVSPPGAISFHFGPGSAVAHANAAREAGLTVARLDLPFLSRDMDTPDDLRFRPDLLLGDAARRSVSSALAISSVRNLCVVSGSLIPGPDGTSLPFESRMHGRKGLS